MSQRKPIKRTKSLCTSNGIVIAYLLYVTFVCVVSVCFCFVMCLCFVFVVAVEGLVGMGMAGGVGIDFGLQRIQWLVFISHGQKYMQAAEFLQNVVYISLASSEEDKVWSGCGIRRLHNSNKYILYGTVP